MSAIILGVAMMCQMDLIAGNDDGIPVIVDGSYQYPEKSTVTNHMVPLRPFSVSAVDVWLRAKPHVQSGAYADFRVSLEWQNLGGNGAPIWYTPQRVLTTIGPNNDPAGPAGEAAALGVSTVPYSQDANGDWVPGWVDDSAQGAPGRWYRFVFEPPVAVAPPAELNRALHFVGRRWPRVTGAPKQGDITWPHAEQAGLHIVPYGVPPVASIHGETGIIWKKATDPDWERPDNPHGFCGKMRIWGFIED